MGWNLNCQARIVHATIASIALPIVPGETEMAIGWNSHRYTVGTDRDVAAITLPAMTRCGQKTMGRHRYGGTGLMISRIAAITFPCGAKRPVQRESMRRNLHWAAGVAIPLKRPIAVPAEVGQMSMGRDRKGHASILGALETPLTVPVITKGIQVGVGGHHDRHAALLLLAITVLAAVSSIEMARLSFGAGCVEKPAYRDAENEQAT